MKQFYFIGSLLFLLLFSGCKKKTEHIEVIFDSSKFYEMWQKWGNLKIENYSYTYLHQGCICFSFQYNVKNDIVINSKSDTSICKSYGPPLDYTIDQIFSLIEGQYLNPYSQKTDDETFVYTKEIIVTYDSLYYFPKFCEILYGSKNITHFCTKVNHMLTEFQLQL